MTTVVAPIVVRVGHMQVLVETVHVPVVGSEPTSVRGKVDKAAEHVLGAFERAEDAIVEVAASTVRMIEAAAARAARPDRLEVEFGLSFSAQGDVIVAGVSGQASLLVRMVYERPGPVAEGGSGGAE